MVMNKKGFMKILEAIIAIVVVFSFVVAIFPEKSKDLGKLPPALQETMDSVLKEIRENAKFRGCVLKEPSGSGEPPIASFGDFSLQGVGADCIYSYIKQLTEPEGTVHPWAYAVSVCKTLEGGATINPADCKYNVDNEIVWDDNKEIRTQNFRSSLGEKTKGQNVYIRPATISVSDASEITITEAINDETALKEKIKDVHLITIYAWLKE